MTKKSTPMNKKAAARIQSVNDRKGGAPKGNGFAQRAQRAAAKNQGKSGKK